MHKHDEVLLTQKLRLIFLHSAGSLSLFTPNGEKYIMEENKNTPIIKIYVACHKESQLPKSSVYIPIHVGAAKSSKSLPETIKDNTGNNISEKTFLIVN